MHFNPCVERRRLAEQTWQYEYSPASFYKLGKQGKVEIRDYQDYLAVLQELEEKEQININKPDESTANRTKAMR